MDRSNSKKPGTCRLMADACLVKSIKRFLQCFIFMTPATDIMGKHSLSNMAYCQHLATKDNGDADVAVHFMVEGICILVP